MSVLRSVLPFSSKLDRLRFYRFNKIEFIYTVYSNDKTKGCSPSQLVLSKIP